MSWTRLIKSFCKFWKKHSPSWRLIGAYRYPTSWKKRGTQRESGSGIELVSAMLYLGANHVCPRVSVSLTPAVRRFCPTSGQTMLPESCR